MAKSKTSKYYEDNPEAAEKRRIYQRKLNKTKKQKKYRAEHTKERRRRGIDGKGGDDVSKKKMVNLYLNIRIRTGQEMVPTERVLKNKKNGISKITSKQGGCSYTK